MSGRKQHFIPQTVLRGFAAAKSGKATQVYVFSKGKPAYLSATQGVAAQRDFYSRPSDEETLDDRITAYEGAVLAPAVAALRDSAPGPLDAHVAAAVVVHLTIRSGFLRGTFSSAAQELLDQFSKVLGSEEKSRTLIGVDSLSTDSMMAKGIDEELQKVLPAELSDADRAFFSKLLHFRMREKFAEMHFDMSALALSRLEVLLDRMPELVVSGHSKALEQGLVPHRRVEKLKTMTWQIVSAAANTHFVLPDCLALGSKTADFRDLEPYALLEDADLNGIVMPVCATKLLVGCTGEPQLDATNLNETFASCSLDFIISSQDDLDTQIAAGWIGTSLGRFLDELIDETFSPPRQVGLTGTNAGEHNSETLLVKFEPAARKSGKAQAAVRNLLSIPELKDGMDLVEYVVISDNVVQSLRQRRLHMTGIAAQSAMSGFCYVVESPAGLKCQLFFPTKMVDAVARGTSGAFEASRLIRHQAGCATYYAHLNRSVPAYVWTRPMPLLTKEGLRSSQRIASHYFGARLSMVDGLSSHEMDEALALWQRTAATCAREIERARLFLMDNNDANTALPHAWVHAELLLTSAAVVSAAFTGESSALSATAMSSDELASLGLSDWLALFTRDLERYFDHRHEWVEDQELRLLASHIERLLWSFGIVLADNGPHLILMVAVAGDRLTEMHRVLRS